MKIKNLWVANVYNCAFVDERGSFIVEPGELVEGKILIKVNDNLYRCPDTNTLYTTSDIFGLNKVDNRSLRPLSEYYRPYFKINKRNSEIIKHVRNNVKILRKTKKI